MGSRLRSHSHAENVLNVLEDEIKNTYKAIPNKNFLYFLCEAELKYINRNKTNDEMLKEIIDCFNLVSNFEVYVFEKDSSFLYNENLNELFNDSSSDESDYD